MEQKAQEIVYPCAACRIQRRKCGDTCVLAPYFPPNDPQKFLVVRKFFGTSNFVKIIQDIPAEKRADAVTSMVYEASARVQDPIYGCTGRVCRLQKQLLQLQSQLATAQTVVMNAQADLLSLTTGFYNSGEVSSTLGVTHDVTQNNDDFIVLDDDQDLLRW